MTAVAEELLKVLQHGDSAFPSGGFAFSQGLEAASQLQEILGDFDLAGFIEMQIRHRWANSDRIALVRSHRLAPDLEALIEVDHEVEAATLMEPLRLGSRRNGMALLTAHGRISSLPAQEYRGHVRQGHALGHVAIVQGLVWNAIGLSEENAVALSGYQCVMALATASIRLGLVGAIEVQKIVSRSLPLIAEITKGPVAVDCPLSSFVPLSEMALLLHGSSEQKLFSN